MSLYTVCSSAKKPESRIQAPSTTSPISLKLLGCSCTDQTEQEVLSVESDVQRPGLVGIT